MGSVFCVIRGCRAGAQVVCICAAFLQFRRVLEVPCPAGCLKDLRDVTVCRVYDRRCLPC